MEFKNPTAAKLAAVLFDTKAPFDVDDAMGSIEELYVQLFAQLLGQPDQTFDQRMHAGLAMRAAVKDAINGTRPPRLREWSELIREVELPADVAAVVATSRSQMLPMAARDMPKAEVLMLLKLIGVYMDTNWELQRHCARLAKEIKEVRKALGGLQRVAERAEAAANFQEPDGSNEDQRSANFPGANP